MWALLLKFLPGPVAAFFGGRLGLYLGIGALASVLVLTVLLRVFHAGANAVRTEALNATLQRLRDRLATKNRQLDAANHRPGRDELGRVFEQGDF